MAHHVRIRTPGGWAALTAINPQELEDFDAAQFRSINGDAGGNWSPTASITISGGNGLHAYRLRGGNDGLGNSTVEINGTGMVVDADAEFNAGVTFAGGSDINFDGQVNFNDGVDFDGAIDATGATSLHLNADGLELKANEGKALRKDAQAFNLRMTAYEFRSYTGSLWSAQLDLAGGGGPGIVRQTGGTSAGFGYVEVYLSPSCTYDNFIVVGKAAAGHGGLMPGQRVGFQVFKIDMSTRVRTNLSAIVAAPSTIGPYEAMHTVILPVTLFRPSTQECYYVEMSNESGSNAITGYEFQGIAVNGFSDRWARCPRDPYLYT